MREELSYQTVWNGSKAFNRGYLVMQAEEPRQPPKREDWSKSFPPPQPTILDRVVVALRERPHTSKQLQLHLNATQSAISMALYMLRQTGKLHSVSQSGHPRARGKSYWIVP